MYTGIHNVVQIETKVTVLASGTVYREIKVTDKDGNEVEITLFSLDGDENNVKIIEA